MHHGPGFADKGIQMTPPGVHRLGLFLEIVVPVIHPADAWLDVVEKPIHDKTREAKFS